MWKLLYQLASPNYFYTTSRRYIPYLSFAAFLCLFVGIVWGLVFAPPDYQQGDAFRIIYIHVPAAFLSVIIYADMGFLAILLLVWRLKMAGLMLVICAEVGGAMALLALITGSLWGKPMWGAWWVWDARLTSELILLFIYGAIIATSLAYPNKESGDKIVAILTLVGLFDLPIIHYSVIWWNTLHQGSTVFTMDAQKIHASMSYPLFITLTGLSLYCLVVVLIKSCDALLLRERRQSWVKNLITGTV